MPALLLLAELSNENSRQRFLMWLDALDFPYIAAVDPTIGSGLFLRLLLICREYGGSDSLAVVTIAISDRPKPVLHGVPHFLLCSSSISSRVASRTSNSSIIF